MIEWISDNIEIAGLSLTLVFAVVGAGWTIFVHIKSSDTTSSGIDIGGNVEGDVFQSGGDLTVDNSTHNVYKLNFDLKSISGIIRAHGGLTAEEAEALRVKYQRAENDLSALRKDHPDWGDEIDAIVGAFNAGEISGAKRAFRKLDKLMDDHRTDLTTSQAHSLYAEATLLYPYEYTTSVELLEKAATLAKNNFWYWVDYGDVRKILGHNKLAQTAYKRGFDIATASGKLRDLTVSLERVADIDKILGAHDDARKAYVEGLEISRGLAAELKTPEARRDLSVSLERVADMDAILGAHDDARKAFVEGLEIRRGLAAELKTPEARRDLTVLLIKVADIDAILGAYDDVRKAYVEGLEISRSLAAELKTPEARRDLVASFYKIILLEHHATNNAIAKTYFEQAFPLIEELHPLDRDEAMNTFLSLKELIAVED